MLIIKFPVIVSSSDDDCCCWSDGDAVVCCFTARMALDEDFLRFEVA